MLTEESRIIFTQAVEKMQDNNNSITALRSPIADDAHILEAPPARADFTVVTAFINRNSALTISNEWLAGLVQRLEELTQQLLIRNGLESDQLPTVTQTLLSLLETMINSLQNQDEHGPQPSDVNHAAMIFLSHYRTVDIPPFCSEHQLGILALNLLVAFIFFALILNSICGLLSSSPADRQKSRGNSALVLKISSPIMAMQFLYILNAYFSWRKHIKTCEPEKVRNELRQQVEGIVAAYKDYCKPYRDANYFSINMDKRPANFRELVAKFYASLPRGLDDSQLAILAEFSESATPDGEKFYHLLKYSTAIEVNQFVKNLLRLPVITSQRLTLGCNPVMSFTTYTFINQYIDILKFGLESRRSSVTNPIFDHHGYHKSDNHEEHVTSQSMFFYHADNDQRHSKRVAAKL